VERLVRILMGWCIPPAQAIAADKDDAAEYHTVVRPSNTVWFREGVPDAP